MLGVDLIEWIGYLGSLIILISMMVNSVIKIRLINLFGAIILSVYTLMINSYPLAIVNVAIAFLDMYYLIRIYREKECFNILEISKDENY